MKDWIEEKVFRKHLWRIRTRSSISLKERGKVKFNKEENLSKCSDQILLLTKLKENWSLGTKENEKEEEEGKEKLILINRWSDEFKPKSEWTSQENKYSRSTKERLTRDKSII